MILMFSTNARQVMGMLAGLILGLFASFWVLNFLNWTPDNSSLGARLGTIILFGTIGIIAGLIFEKSTRAHYQAAMAKNLALKQRTEKAVGTHFKLGYIVGGLYLLYRIAGYYALFALGYGLSSTTHLELVLEAIGEGVIALVFFWLYAKREKNTGLSNIKRTFLCYCIFFLILAVVDCIALLVSKPASPEAQVPIPGSSNYQLVPLTDFAKVLIGDLDGYQGKIPYFIEVDGTIDQTSIPGTEGIFSVRDSGGRVAYIDELGLGTTMPVLQTGATITIYGSIQTIRPAISASNPALIYVKGCGPSSGGASDFICG